MSFFKSIGVALNMLRLHKLRAFLTMLGVIIGVMSVTLIIMLSNGFKTYLKGEFDRIGSNTIFVYYSLRSLKDAETAGDITGLKLEDRDYVLDRCDMIDAASGFREAGMREVRFGSEKSKEVKARAADAQFFDLNRINLLSGRLYTTEEVNNYGNVTVISEQVAKDLFGNDEPLGKLITCDGLTLEVIGVCEKLEMMGERSDRLIFVPLLTATKKWLGGDSIDLMLLRPKEGYTVSEAMEQVWQALMVKTNNRTVFTVESSENVLKVFQGVIGGAGIVLAAVAALSLLVGGIGIMNIMLVSVTERTREIGLRKALGAKKASILTQFLVESAVLSLVGGLIGMLIAYLLGLGVHAMTAAQEFPNKGGLPAVFPLSAAIGASLFSAAIGIVFGLYPALNAAKLDPIVALRSE